jgi:hypothetical protein
MAAKPKRRAAKKAASRAAGSRAAAPSKAKNALGETMDQGVKQGQQVMRGWTAAYGAALKGWSDMLRTSADTATRAAKAFDDEMK